MDKKLGEHTVSRHAVLGVKFFQIFIILIVIGHKQYWTEFFSGKHTKISFWEACVNYNRLYRYTFADLHTWYNEFANKNILSKNRKHAFESTISHVILAYFYDLEHADNIFQKFLEIADCDAIETLCISNRPNIG